LGDRMQSGGKSRKVELSLKPKHIHHLQKAFGVVGPCRSGTVYRIRDSRRRQGSNSCYA
jgi:hypothetical protein